MCSEDGAGLKALAGGRTAVGMAAPGGATGLVAPLKGQADFFFGVSTSVNSSRPIQPIQ